MKIDDIVKVVASLPQAKDVGEMAYWEEVTPSFVNLVIEQVVANYDWDFIMDEYSTVTSVSGQADYTLTGRNNSLRDIVSIRYGTEKTVLSKMRTLDADEALQNSPSISSVSSWFQALRDAQGFPIVTLIATPTATGDILRVRYRVKNIPLDRFPEEFNYVIAYGVLAWVAPDYTRLFNSKLKNMVKRYSLGGKDYQPVSYDPHIMRTNRKKATLNRGSRRQRVDT
jgi:hypothetical protein